ncbi:MAG TPA: bifunctional DNA-formamidopyrimidine glycosylase/DNA-(apurinic or apyrimidinic site) lyase [Candidatus Aminicenantes bacterium]|nr:bifunctional DNA-formamidopyrimidine glycosylase/DNA-(apurinic or apyrimidinic site) lyase [Candidatus Aminicenantes bacterium]
MPELPEVETIARSLAPRVAGRRIAGVELLYRPLLRRGGRKGLEALRGRRVVRVRRRGKMLLVECEGGRTLVFHLKMTGQFLFAAEGSPRDKHIRLVVRFEDGRDELRFRDVRKFGFLLCLEGEPERACAELAALGPEPLEVGLPGFAAIIKARKGRVKSLLLDQRRIAGVGNIYADETLFGARVHPETPASSLGPEAVERLFRAMRRILAAAVEAGGSTLADSGYRDADGNAGGFQFDHKVYGRAGEPCLVCGTPIRMKRVGGRSSHFCPRCQRPPRRRAP